MNRTRKASQVGTFLLVAFSIAFLALAVRAESGVREIVVVYKTHFDIGYTDLVTNVLTGYRTRFVDEAMKVIESSRSRPSEQQFVWTVPGWPLKEMLWPGQTPERRKKILQAMKDRRLTVHAMPFSLQTESLDLEDLVRGMKFSSDLANENGLPLPRAAKMTDVPEHTWVLPVLLKHSGVNFLHIGCNGASAPMQVPSLFWWEGPDGSRLLTFYSPQYGTQLMPPAHWPYHTWLAMIMTSDNHGPPTAEEVDNLLRRAEKELPGVRIKFGRLEDFYDAIMAEKNGNIPVIRGDMPDTWIHGFESMPMETKLAWNVRPLESALALLDTELRDAGVKTPPVAEPLARAYENSLLYSEHTFGYYGSQPGGFWYGDEWAEKLGEGKYDRFLKSFDDKRDYIRTTANIVTNALDARMQLLAQNVDAEGPRIVVFNPLPWKRSSEVEINLPPGAWTGVRDLSSGRIVEGSTVDDQTLRFIAKDVPAGGYNTFAPVANVVAQENTWSSADIIENKFFRLRVDAAKGGLISLIDLETGREMVSTNDANSFGSYWHERFANTNVAEFAKAYTRGRYINDFSKPGMPGPDKLPYATFTLTNWTVSVQKNALTKTIVLRSENAAPLAKSVTLKYTLYESQPYLDVEWAVEDKTPNPIPEGGWLCLPFAIDQPQFQLARLGSIINPATDIISGGNRHLFCLNSGMTVTGRDGYGVGLCPLDSPLVSLDEPGLWRFSPQYTPKRARIFVNLYNNEWDTNFPLWQNGSWHSRVRIWMVRGHNAEKNLITPAWNARVPLLAACATGPRGKLSLSKTGSTLSRRGVLVTYFGPDPYSEQTLLRVWEQAGQAGSLTVKLSGDCQATQAFPVNLRGEPAGDALKIIKGSFTFKLAAFTPASFRLTTIAPPPTHTVCIEEEVPANVMTVTASSEFSPGWALHLVDGSGMQDGVHDNNHSSQTMWHTTQWPSPTPPAAGLPASPAWVRFHFSRPQKFDSIKIWNHNQENLTERGFRRTRLFGTTDGTTWFALTSPGVIELPRAEGSPGLEAAIITNAARSRPLKSVAIAAEAKEGNYGGDYFGLSAVRFGIQRTVAESDLPIPTNMACAALPYCPYRPDGKPGREIAVSLKGGKLYGVVTIGVECAGEKEQTTVAANTRGAERFSVFLPPGASITNECDAVLELHAERVALKQDVHIPACKPRIFYVLMHSHCDIGYTDIQPHIAAKQAHNVIRALDLIDQTRDYPPNAQFKWNTEVFWQVEQFYKIATPEQKLRFEQAVREHRIGLDAMYGNLLTGLARGEELLRQMEFTTELGRRCGVKVDSMMISDVPGLIWGIVPALAQAGAKYISDGPNPGARIGYIREQWENNPFWWVSPSGRERAIYWGAQGGYAIGHHSATIRDAIAELTPQLEEAGYPYDMVQLRWTKGDNGGPDESVMPIVRDWNVKYAWPKLVITTTSEMFHEFEKRYGDKLPVYRGDMTPYWEDGAGSSARETGLNRLSSDRMTQGEILWTMLKPDALPKEDYADALKNIAMYSEHTWGAYNSISAPDSDFVKAQWKIKQAFALDGESETKKLLTDALATRGAPENASAIDVFNTASWPRTDLVTCPKSMQLAGSVVKNDRGELLPSQRLVSGELVFIAKDVPPFGGRRFTIEAGSANLPGKTKAEGSTLTDSTITLKLDENSGAIASLIADGVDHDFVDRSGHGGLNDYVYLPGGNVNDAQRNDPVKISVKENGPLVVSLLVESEAPGCNKLLREVRLVEGLDRVEIIDTIDKKPVRTYEGVHIGFEFNVPDPKVRMSVPWGVIQPEQDQLAGACKNWFSVERWVDISNDKLGVTWSTTEAPLVEVGGLTANLPGGPAARDYLFKIKAVSRLFSWIMNNHWFTNYRADQQGKTVFHYALRPHAAYDQTVAAHFGVESTEPLIAALAAGPAPAGPLVEISSGSIMITSASPTSDGQALILRLYNTGESAAQAALKWNGANPKAIYVSDLSGLRGAPASSAIEMAAYEVRTLRAELR